METQGEDGHRQTKERGLEQILPLWPSEGTNPADALVLDVWPLELGGNTFLLLKSPSLWYFVTAALAN